jgi:bisphosphoglycerate-independent phosphoglycerate mutase (AlkP superfamily)
VNMRKKSKTDEQYEAIREKQGKSAVDALVQAQGRYTLATPGWRRWNKAMAQIETAMIRIESEMEAYHDQRPKRWRRGKRAYELILRLKDLQDVKDAVAIWLDYPPMIDSAGSFVTLREWEDRNAQTA